jgi:hypothetical protein
MRWRFWIRREVLEAGERMRQEHSAWLTDALLSERPYPQIPLRRVDEGGFDHLMQRPSGPERAASWWSAAFRRVDRVEGR